MGSNGHSTLLLDQDIRQTVSLACADLKFVDYHKVLKEAQKFVRAGGDYNFQLNGAILSARSFVELEPNYAFVAARLLLDKIYRQSGYGVSVGLHNFVGVYPVVFKEFIQRGIQAGLLDKRLGKKFDLDRLADAIEPKRDFLFKILGLQTLYDRYLLRDDNDIVFEWPQFFYMRVAMGLALNEKDPTSRAIEFYHVISQHYYSPATPTLFFSGTVRPQLSSCYLLTTDDSIEGIFRTITQNASLSKWAGGIGNDWTPIRGLGSKIKGTGGKSQGVIPFLKVVDATAVAVDQGGRRKGAVCSYLEIWHIDVEEFMELRRNTGDERRRTHDMHTALWVPDLFMKRVLEDGNWTLFSPDEVPDLHDLYGVDFEIRYVEYEQKVQEGKITNFKVMKARDLWRKSLTMLFETGHPWITWKDPINIRSPQQHCGVIHSSNLCTETHLNTSEDEIAVCNLGSLNLPKFVCDGNIDYELLDRVIKTAIRMLDNVIDINFYPLEEARRSNMRHRPIGLGVMGTHDLLLKLGLDFDSDDALQLTDELMEHISYSAIQASSDLAYERGAYKTFKGSQWSQGNLPLDTLKWLEINRGSCINVNKNYRLDWSALREKVKKYGMRNSHVLTIAPTATISMIVGTSQSIEPYYSNLYVKSSLSGEFIQVNEFLVRELQSLGLWGEKMLDALKYYAGSVQQLDIPDDLKRRFRTAFELPMKRLVDLAAIRQKWIDMGQSFNIYFSSRRGKDLDDIYTYCWKCGLKTTYYLRTLGATSVEQSTVDINAHGIQPRWMKSESPSSRIKLCRLDDPTCESCQ